MAHRIAGKCRRPFRIQLFHKLLQSMMVVQHIVSVFSRNRNLIGNSPRDDTWMIIVLHNQLPHLKKRILPAVRHMRRNIWNFCPDNHPITITQIIKMLMMLVVRQPNGISPHFTDQLHIFLHMTVRNRISDSFPILMPGHAPQRIGHTV